MAIGYQFTTHNMSHDIMLHIFQDQIIQQTYKPLTHIPLRKTSLAISYENLFKGLYSSWNEINYMGA